MARPVPITTTTLYDGTEDQCVGVLNNEPNAVGLAKGRVDGASFGDAHLGAVD